MRSGEDSFELPNSATHWLSHGLILLSRSVGYGFASQPGKSKDV